MPSLCLPLPVSSDLLPEVLEPSPSPAPVFQDNRRLDVRLAALPLVVNVGVNPQLVVIPRQSKARPTKHRGGRSAKGREMCDHHC